MEILLNTAECLVIFYSTYYIVSSIAFGAFSLRDFDGRMPFDFESFIDFSKCCTSYTRQETANLLSMELTYFFSAWAYAAILPKRVWDFSTTVTFIHIALCCLVMLSFPVSWSWWVSLGAGLLVNITIGEITLYWLHKIKEERKVHNSLPG